MNRDRIIQVRVDPELASRLRRFADELRASDSTANESVAVRTLLRQALAKHGSPIPSMDAGYNEGLRRAYAEVRGAISAALRPLLDGKERR